MAKPRLALIAAICLFLISGVLFTGRGSAQESDPAPEVLEVLKSIEKNVSGIKGLSTQFVQEKKLAAFRNVIKLKGRIYIGKPNKLAWHVDEPIKYSILITDKTLRQWDRETGKVREISISSNPMLSVALNQMTVWFTGRYVSLLANYDVALLGRSPVRLEFAPKEGNKIGKAIKSITIELRKDEKYLKKIIIREVGGDNTAINFMNTTLAPPKDKQLFEVTGNGR